jgi:hypothetical protein
MKRIIIIIALTFTALTVFAQQQPSPEEINALLQAVAAQRETASNQVAQLSAKLTVLTAENDKLKVMDCKPKPEKKP